MPRRLFLPLLLIVFLAIAPVAYAQTGMPVVGSLLEVEGTVSMVMPGDEAKLLKASDPIHMNDVIETAAGSRAFILLIDNTELTLGENAQLKVDEYVFDEENTALNKGRYSVLRGAFLYTSGLVAKKENPDVTVQTPYGAVGIRGTTFWGGELDDEYGVLVTEGSITVQTDRGRINVNKGQGTMLRSKTSIPTRAGVWAQDKIGRAVQTIALKNSGDMAERVTRHAEAQQQDRLKYKEYLLQRLEQKQLQNGTRQPSTRIDNVPHLRENQEIAPSEKVQQPAAVTKPEPVKPAALDDAPPAEAPVRTAPVPDNLNKPFMDETAKKPAAGVGQLLKAAPTNVAPATQQTTPALDKQLETLKEEVKDKGADAATPGAPDVDLPIMGTNEAHTNEMKEQQHMEQRRQPMVRRDRAAPPAAGGKSKAADAL